MDITKQLITPEIAKEYLSVNRSNRKIKDPVVLRYSQDMKAGRWKEDTAEFIKIFKSGTVGDGQHRLLAVIKSNTPIWFHVAKGIDDKVMDVLDTGSLRSSVDVFTIVGIKNSTSVPSIISFFYILKNEFLGRNQKYNRLTNAEILILYNSDTDYWQSITNNSHNNYKSFAKILSPSSIGGFLAYFDTINSVDSKEFFNQLCTGLNLKCHAIHILRNRLISDRSSLKKLPPVIKYAFIIKAWNSFRQPHKNDIKILKFTPGVEDFPTAI